MNNDECLDMCRTALREALRDADTLNDAEGVSDPEWNPDDVTGEEWRKMGARLAVVPGDVQNGV